MIRWDENRWETEYDLLMGHARSHLDPAWTQGQVVVLKTAKENIYTVEIVCVGIQVTVLNYLT